MELAAITREVKGKKVKALRRQGVTPVNLFGHNVESAALQCDSIQLRKALAGAGTTGLLNLMIDRAKKPRSVMFREVQREPLSGEVLHVDFYQVDMDKKVRVEVPVVTVGQSPALKLKENFLANEMTSLFVECLPGRIPNRIEVDITPLTEAGQAVHVKDIKLGDGITVVSNPEQAVVKISLRFVEKEVPAQAAAAAEAGAEATAGGEAKAEGEAAGPAK